MDQVLCKRSNEASDVRCSICGQGFLVYWSRFSRAEQDDCRRQIQNELRNHHTHNLADGGSHEVHPGDGFSVPLWAGAAPFAAASPMTGDGAQGV